MHTNISAIINTIKIAKNITAIKSINSLTNEQPLKYPTIDFGANSLSFKDIAETIDNCLFADKGPGFDEYEILDNLKYVSGYGNEVFAYSVNSDTAYIANISLLDLLNSNNDHELALGCLIACNILDKEDGVVYIDDVIKIDDCQFGPKLTRKSLGELILKKDNSGFATLTIALLFEDKNREDIFYKKHYHQILMVNCATHLYLMQNCILILFQIDF